eukprot:2954329-Pleurochrysis_carterae.AAC.1
MHQINEVAVSNRLYQLDACVCCSRRLSGRAVTLNFVPQRPDIAADKPAGVDSPEYEAFELCGPKNVLVMSSVGPWESVGGDIKFLRLQQLGLGGLVTDGSVRDTDEILGYGFPVFSYSTTPKQGEGARTDVTNTRCKDALCPLCANASNPFVAAIGPFVAPPCACAHARSREVVTRTARPE